jgi:peptide/nickel transport system substrate-binding protein
MRVSVRVVALAGLLALAHTSAQAQTPKRGGVLTLLPLTVPSSLSPHEESTMSTLTVAAPCFNNLVTFDSRKSQESVESVVPELAERWAWQDGGRALVFFLRKGVRWHDGQPFTAKDVKYTFDMVRGAPEAEGKLRINPRQDWYANVTAVEAIDPHTVVFRLRRPQPSLLILLATDYSPVYPAHVNAREFRNRCVGTGPFRFKEYRLGEVLVLERNPDYFLPNRPYVDAIRVLMIEERSSQVAAMVVGQADINSVSWSRVNAEQAKSSQPKLVVVETSTNVNDNIPINVKRTPFNDVRLRRAVDLALDRKAYIDGVRQGGATIGTSLLPPPRGVWGMPPAEVATLPGRSDGATGRAEAKKLLAEAGYGPDKPLQVAVTTRSASTYVEMASWVVDQLRQVGIQGTVDQVDTSVWFSRLTRRDFQIGVNQTGNGVDDPDANFYQNYKCGSPRNYTDYCSPEVDRLIDEQSQATDPAKRLKLVRDLERRLQLDGARVIVGWPTRYVVHWPHVKGWIPSASMHNHNRMQDVWLDK